MFDECLSFIENRCDKCGVKIVFARDFLTKASIRDNKIRFMQSLLNLSSNAVKYNREKGKLTLGCEEAENGLLRVSVTDTGEGISESDLIYLFEPSTCLKSKVKAIEGTGIGLTITRQLIESMGGKIGVDSEVGKGTRF